MVLGSAAVWITGSVGESQRGTNYDKVGATNRNKGIGPNRRDLFIHVQIFTLLAFAPIQ